MDLNETVCCENGCAKNARNMFSNEDKHPESHTHIHKYMYICRSHQRRKIKPKKLSVYQPENDYYQISSHKSF